MGKQEKKQYVFRGSEVGQCPRLLSYKLLGRELETVSGGEQARLNKGTDQEGAAIAYLGMATAGGKVVDQQREVRWGFGNVLVVGHIDGIVEYPKHSEAVEGVSGRHLLEIKSMGKDRFELFKAEGLAGFPLYDAQVRAYWEALKQEGEVLDGVTVVAKLWGEEEYVLWFGYGEGGGVDGKGDNGGSEYSGVVVAKRLLSVVNAAKKNEVVADMAPDEFGCRKCSGRYLCFPQWIPRTTSEDEAVELVQQHLRMADAEKAMKKKKDEVRKKLEALLKKENTENLEVVGAGSVSMYERSTTKTVDAPWEVLRQVDELLAPYRQTTVTKTLRVTAAKLTKEEVGEDDDE